MKIGAHVSIAGGLEKSIEKGLSCGADCLQIFVSSPRVWKMPAHSAESIRRFREAREKAGIDPIFIHTIYLLNLASPDDGLWGRSIESLDACLRLADELESGGVVTHLGSGAGASLEENERRVCLALETATRHVAGRTPLLLETSAGSGSSVGSNFASIGRIVSALELVAPVLVCLDTAHVFAAGYDISSVDGLEQTLSEFEDKIGLDRLNLVHVNDSKMTLGSRVDRHANIGQGNIGAQAIGRFIQHPAIRNVPLVTEVPGLDGKGPGARDIALLRNLAGG